MSQAIMTSQRACEITQQWASYMTLSDPGICFCRFHYDDGRPVSEEHRQECLVYTADLIEKIQTPTWLYTPGPTLEADLAELQALSAFFSTTDLATVANPVAVSPVARIADDEEPS